MTKNKLYFTSLLALLVIVACTEFDDTLPGEFTKDISPSSPAATDDGDSAVEPTDGLAGAYFQLREAGSANHGGYFTVQELPSDEMLIAQKGGDWFDGGILIQLHRHTYDPSHEQINGTW